MSERKTTNGDSSGRREILVVDDVAANLDLLAGLLAEAGYKVRATPSAELALQSAQAHPPALMLLDVRMPGMDGFEACRRLKQDERTRNIPIVFVSGQNEVTDRVQGFAAGGVDFIGKPFQRQEVLARVKTHLALYEAQVELERRVGERTAELETSLGQLAEHRAKLEATVVERTAELVSSERRTRAIVATMLESVIHIDAHGKIGFVNFATEELFGYTEEEMLGRNVSMLMPEPHASAHDGYLARFLQTRERKVIGYRTEVLGRRKDGSLLPLELAVNEMVDDNGSTFLGVLRNMTAQKAAERALTEALQKANAATEAKSNFLANMSHEIRTPLNAVLGLAQIGVRENRGRETATLFERIRDSGNHLLGVVNDILDFSKIEANKLRVDLQPFALQAAIDKVKSFVAQRAEEKGLTLTVSLDPGLSDWVEGDALRLTQILTNLLSNAIKFAERGEVILRAARDGRYVEFMVADNGLGMNEEQLGRLFQPFEQADASVTRNYGGTGLGLAISRELARLMGGDIAVDSAPGAGSSFYLRLPLPSIPAPNAAAGRLPGAAKTGRRLADVSILAADDVELNRYILEDLVTHEGARIVLACDGQEAVDMVMEAGADAFDVVLMDVQMPVLDGLAATRRIAAIAPGLPVIGLTAHAMAEERHRCLAAGMRDHVVKPVDIDLLVDAIRQQLAAARPQVGLSAPPGTAAAPALPPDDTCNDPQIIDLNILAERVGRDPAKIAKYTAMFIDSAREVLDKMRTAQELKDMAAMSGLGHRLKSAALTVGAMRFAELCRELEDSRPGCDPETTGASVDALHALFERILCAVRNIVRI